MRERSQYWRLRDTAVGSKRWPSAALGAGQFGAHQGDLSEVRADARECFALHAMVHGGPFPAASIKPLAIDRLLRPVAPQDFPADLLPAALRDGVHHAAGGRALHLLRRGRSGMMGLAGVAGFEPAHGGTKNRCLTTWLHPIEPGALIPRPARFERPSFQTMTRRCRPMSTTFTPRLSGRPNR